MATTRTILIVLMAGLLQQCSYSQSSSPTNREKMDSTQKKHAVYSNTDTSKVNVSNAEWEKVLRSDVYAVARQKGTERPWTSPYESLTEKGTYYCAVCGNALFKSDTKFESGCGWPSFYEPISKGSIIYIPDNSHGMTRTEVECGRCKSHLGHVFNDGPPPTGLRYCINGVVLDFAKAKEAEKKYNEKP
ncbi:MAG: peptide-methionine (R)-S-oxide reductase MsrB [Chitinophagaceae bacterium]